MRLLYGGFLVIASAAGGCGKSTKGRGVHHKQEVVESDLSRQTSSKSPETPQPLIPSTESQEDPQQQASVEADPIKLCAEQGGRWLKEECVMEDVPLCSDRYVVPASANPYLAGMPNGSTIVYHTGLRGNAARAVDTAPQQSPVKIIPTHTACMKPGSSLYFEVSGTISHGSAASASNADGRKDINGSRHTLGAHLGKSAIIAPLNSLVGVFLGGGDPSTATPPAMLDFSQPEQRNLLSFSPAIGQIFFIGDAKTDSGEQQKVIIPAGAEHLFIGIMDAYQWSNNSGQLQIAIKSAQAKTP